MKAKSNLKSKFPSIIVDFNEHDDSLIARAVLPRTESTYDDVLEYFDEFLGNHPQAVNPPNTQTCKAFLEYYGRNAQGRVAETPTIESVQTFLRRFTAAMKRRRMFTISKELSTTLHEYILQVLRDKVPLSDSEMDKHALSPNDLTILMVQLWCRDFKEYRGEIPDRTRVQMSAAMLLYCFTSARTGEVHESTARRRMGKLPGANPADATIEARAMAACYKHFELTIETVDGMLMLVLTYTRAFIKGHWRRQQFQLPIHAFYDTYKEKVPLFLNFLTFFLPMATADNAFRDYSSVSEILDAVKAHEQAGQPRNQVLEVIEFSKNVKNTPVFRPYNELDVDTSTGKARGADAFGKEFVELGYRSGYSHNITIRACRRWALMEADKTHSESARMKFAGQTNRDTYGKSYAHPLSEVDGPANYLGIASRKGHIQNRRGMGRHYNSRLWQSLPAKAEFEFQDRDDVRNLDAEMCYLSTQLPSLETQEQKNQVYSTQHRIYNEKQRLYREELKKLRNSQSRKPGVGQESLYEQGLFFYRRRAMPERDLLADYLPQEIELQSHDGRKSLEALETLCKQKPSVAYRAGLQPHNGVCLCGKAMDQLYPHRRWSHLYRCYRAHTRLRSAHDFAELCFECGIWFSEKCDWEDHCREHLEKPDELLRCDPMIFRNAPIKAGYCPFCLGNKIMSPSRRMTQFIESPPQWHSHIQAHLEKLGKSFSCTHPACLMNFENLESLEHHLVDIHCYRPLRTSALKRKAAIENPSKRAKLD